MKSSLKIIHTEASHGWGGQEIRILSEAEWFREQGHEIIILAPEVSQLFQKAKAAGFTCHAIPFAKNTQLKDLFRVKKIIKEEKADIIGTHSSVDSWVGLVAGSLAKVPCRLRYRHISAPVRASKINAWQYNKLCDHIITTGQCIRGPLLKSFGLPEDKIDVIGTGLKFPESLTDSEAARLQLCKQLNVSDDAMFMGSVAVLRSWKGHGYTIKAFEVLAKKFSNLHFVLVGDGPMKDVLEEEAAQTDCSDRIHFTGHQQPVWDYFRAFKIALLVSTKNEGIPQSGLQALYSQTPLIGTTVGGIPEIIKDGYNGLLIQPEDSNAIAQAVERFLTNGTLESELIKNTRVSIEDDYNIDAMGNRVLKVIQKYLR